MDRRENCSFVLLTVRVLHRVARSFYFIAFSLFLLGSKMREEPESIRVRKLKEQMVFSLLNFKPADNGFFPVELSSD